MRRWFIILPPSMVSLKWTCQLSCGSTLPMAAATPPSAITVWALPSSDLQIRPPSGPRGVGFAQQRLADRPAIGALCLRFNGRAQARAARADHQYIVFISL